MPPKSPLIAKEEVINAPKYSTEELAWLGKAMAKLFRAKTERDTIHPELGGMTVAQYYQENERVANTFIPRREFDNDIVISSGTVEQKLYSVLAEINRLNLSPEVRAYDTDEYELVELGRALTDIVLKSEELEPDEENKLLRQVELLKQGTVYVQENWIREFKLNKKLSARFEGKVEGLKWQSEQEKCYEGPRRVLLYSPGVYEGNMREFDIQKQPFIFTHRLTSYAEAESRYGAKDKDGKLFWERWENVPKNKVTLLGEDSIGTTAATNGFSLVDLQGEMVEEIHYQDKWSNEYQIFLNGVMMLPVGFPLTAISPSGGYNIAKQVFQAINPFFSRGRSFVAKTTNISDLLDEMIRLLILKTRKSIHPPYANISGKVISSKSLMPGRITMGIDPSSLQPIGQEAQGVTAGEYQMMNKLQDNIDRVTVSPQFQGQQGKSGTTATEVGLLSRQAQKVLSLTVFVASLLEQKLGYLRLYNILANHFEPVSQELDETRKVLKNKYRQTSRTVSLPGRGQGVRQIIPTEDALPDAEQIFNEEEYQGSPEAVMGTRQHTRDELGMPPMEKIYLNPKEVAAAKLVFLINVDSREKDTSANAKNIFREQLQDIQQLMLMGSRPNMKEIESEYARVWGKRPEQLFSEAPPPGAVGPQGESTAGGGQMPNLPGRPSAAVGSM